MSGTTTDFTVASITLTDGSVAFNVQGRVDDQLVVIGAAGREDAERMVELLNNAAWIEITDDAHDIGLCEARARPVELFDPEDSADQLACMREAASDRPSDDEESNCFHEWVETETEHGEGRTYCLLCGADGDA